MFLMFLPPFAPQASLSIKSNKIVIKLKSPQLTNWMNGCEFGVSFDGFKMGLAYQHLSIKI